jgi:CO/xanthine dehydrogenase Mo-binding subunit
VVKDEVTSNVGNTTEAMSKDDAKTLKATYDFAIHTHGSIGPSCAVAELKDGKLTSWSASQATHALRGQLAAPVCRRLWRAVRASAAASSWPLRP